MHVVFSTLFSVLHLVMTHCVSCLMYYLKINWQYPSIGLNHSLENLRSFFRTLKVCKIINHAVQKVCPFDMRRLFDPFCCLESIITYLPLADFIFAPGKPSCAKPTCTWYIFLKFDTSLEKLTTNRFREFFLKLLTCYNRLKNSPSSDFYMARDLSWLDRSPDHFAAKKACPAC